MKINFVDLFNTNSKEYTDITIYCDKNISQSVLKILFLCTKSIGAKYRGDRATIHGAYNINDGKSIKIDWKDIDFTNSTK